MIPSEMLAAFCVARKLTVLDRTWKLAVVLTGLLLLAFAGGWFVRGIAN